jgi:HAD superfamily hydrolase (TIGR01549 family)
MITTVLFDLDGTLLPMELDQFLECYFSLLAKKLSSHGYDPHKLIDGMWEGINAMIRNDGSATNETVFWDTFCREIRRNAKVDIPLFQEFYENEYLTAKSACGFDPRAAETVAAVKRMGIRVILATNPLYPAVATQARIRWAGLDPDDFVLYTTYEDTYHCKPNPAYYQDILDKLGLNAEECLMVGNDAIEDMAAENLGMQVFLLPRWLVNRTGRDVSGYPQGNFDDLLSYIRTQNKKD